MTSLLEFLQLWHPPFLQLVRSYTLGRLLLGTTFSKWDFFYYAIGCMIGGWWLRKNLEVVCRQNLRTIVLSRSTPV